MHLKILLSSKANTVITAAHLFGHGYIQYFSNTIVCVLTV